MPDHPAMEDKRSGDGRIWAVTFVFLLCIVGGGALLAVYIMSPAEGVDTYRYAVAGMVLVAIPWLFWLLTFLYRCSCKASRPGSPTRDRGGVAAAAVLTAVVGTGTTTVAMPAEALDQSVGGGERRVRFGGATVLDGVEESRKHCQGGPVAVVDVAGQASSSPLTSRECEVPLALAMSA